MRERVKRNLLATLAFSQGVPMLSHGDELGRTQQGNNNAYCQDGPLTWVDWELYAAPAGTARVHPRGLRRSARRRPALRRRDFFPEPPGDGEGLTWLRADGAPMTAADWAHDGNHVLGMLFDGERADAAAA